MDRLQLQLPGCSTPASLLTFIRVSDEFHCVQDLQIISTDDNQVVVAIQDWHQNDSYNLYMSESRGLFFTLMLESVVSSGGPEGNIMIDLYEVGQQLPPARFCLRFSRSEAPRGGLGKLATVHARGPQIINVFQYL